MEFKKKDNMFAVVPRFNSKTQKFETLKDCKIPVFLQDTMFEMKYRNDILSTALRAETLNK